MATVSSEACRKKVSILFEMVQFSATKFIQHRNMHQIPSLPTQSALHSLSSPPKLNYPFLVCIYLWGQKLVWDHSEGDSRCWVLSLKLSTFVPPSILIAVGTLFPPEVQARADLGISATQLGCGTDSPDPAPPSLQAWGALAFRQSSAAHIWISELPWT